VQGVKKLWIIRYISLPPSFLCSFLPWRGVNLSQRITSMAYVYSAALPAILAVTASESLSILETKEGEDLLSHLTANASTLHSILDKSEYLESTSDYNSPILHYRLNEEAVSQFGLSSLQDQERILQDIVDEVLTSPPCGIVDCGLMVG